MPAAMHEIAPAPGDRLMSQDAAKKASQVWSDMPPFYRAGGTPPGRFVAAHAAPAGPCI